MTSGRRVSLYHRPNVPRVIDAWRTNAQDCSMTDVTRRRGPQHKREVTHQWAPDRGKMLIALGKHKITGNNAALFLKQQNLFQTAANRIRENGGILDETSLVAKAVELATRS